MSWQQRNHNLGAIPCNGTFAGLHAYANATLNRVFITRASNLGARAGLIGSRGETKGGRPTGRCKGVTNRGCGGHNEAVSRCVAAGLDTNGGRLSAGTCSGGGLMALPTLDHYTAPCLPSISYPPSNGYSRISQLCGIPRGGHARVGDSCR